MMIFCSQHFDVMLFLCMSQVCKKDGKRITGLEKQYQTFIRYIHSWIRKLAITCHIIKPIPYFMVPTFYSHIKTQPIQSPYYGNMKLHRFRSALFIREDGPIPTHSWFESRLFSYGQIFWRSLGSCRGCNIPCISRCIRRHNFSLLLSFL